MGRSLGKSGYVLTYCLSFFNGPWLPPRPHPHAGIHSAGIPGPAIQVGKTAYLGTEEHRRRQYGEKGQHDFVLKIPETFIEHLLCSRH